jgi:hypothetical protein
MNLLCNNVFLVLLLQCCSVQAVGMHKGPLQQTSPSRAVVHLLTTVRGLIKHHGLRICCKVTVIGWSSAHGCADAKR